MSSKQDVENYLKNLKIKIKVFGILFLDERGKNAQTLASLEIPPHKRTQVIEQLNIENYSEGPTTEKMRNLLPMWVFGKKVNSHEIYIKKSMGAENQQAVCISFHQAERPMSYPYKKAKP